LSVDRSPLFAAIFPGPPGRIVVSAAQFAAGDFPLVCAMTGQPAQTRRRFRFFRAPVWSAVFLFLMCVGIGFLVSGLLIFLVARRVTGYLPLTSTSNQRISLVLQLSVVVVTVGAILLIVAALLAATADPLAHLAGVLLLPFGLMAFVVGFTGLQVGLQMLKPLYGPTAVVLPRQPGHTETWIELRNVHPAFVAAVQQVNSAISTQGL
jgi:hypothetical protein